ncbi:PHD finger protein 20-like protein 1 isoform X2 [Lineus longissimus]|uniref:PHD finger protein 20-like protein 1 isoform X2 n=1 Tax=Lineus longissimus TaxID=88925 RepID=UPI00315CE84C
MSDEKKFDPTSGGPVVEALNGHSKDNSIQRNTGRPLEEVKSYSNGIPKPGNSPASNLPPIKKDMKTRQDDEEKEPTPSASTRKGSTGNTPDSKKTTPPKFPPLPDSPDWECGSMVGKIRTRNLSSASVSSAGSSLKSSRFPVRPGISWRVNARVEAMDFLEKWYPAKIVEMDEDDLTILIHFEGWNQRYDEWVPMTTDRLRPMTRHSDRKEGKPVTKLVHKLGEKVLAKWTDCRMYPAKVVSVNQNGSYEVVFYDGFKKTIQPINVKPLPAHMQEEVQNIAFPAVALSPPVPPPKKKEDGPLPRSRSKERDKGKEQSKSKSRDRSKSSGSEQGGSVPRKNSEKSAESCNPMLSRRNKGQSRSLDSKPPARKPSGDNQDRKGEPKPSDLGGLFSRKRKIKVGGIFQAKRLKLDPDVAQTQKKLPSPKSPQKLNRQNSKPKTPGPPKVLKLSDLPKPGVPLSPGGHVLAVPGSPRRVGSPGRSPVRSQGMSPTRSPLKVEAKKGGTRTVAEIKKKLMDKRKAIEAERQAKHLAEEASKPPVTGPADGLVPESQSPPFTPESEPVPDTPESGTELLAPASRVEEPDRPAETGPYAVTSPEVPENQQPQKVLENLLKGGDIEKKESKESMPLGSKNSDDVVDPSLMGTSPATEDTPDLSPAGQKPAPAKDSLNKPLGRVASRRSRDSVGRSATGSRAVGSKGARVRREGAAERAERPSRKRTQSMPAQAQDDSNSAVSSDGSVNTKIAAKAFKIDPDHNEFKCPWDDCGKSFRKEKLLVYHIKYYHSNDGKPPPPPPPRRRKQTVSMCSTDSTEATPPPRFEKVARSRAAKKVRGHSAPSIIIPDTAGETLEAPAPPEVKLEIDDIDEDREAAVLLEHAEAAADAEKLEQRERQDSIGTESVDVTEDERGSKDEVVNCMCRFNEENGLMIQCEVCLTWQHVSCINISEESLPQKYVCWVCLNPPGVRESARFIYDQEWLKQGTLPRFSFLPTHDKGRRSPVMKTTHSLAGDIHGLSLLINATKKNILILNTEDHEDLKIWVKNWEQEPDDDDDDDDDELKPDEEIVYGQNISAVSMETNQTVETNVSVDPLESSASFLSASHGALDLKEYDEKNVIPPYEDLSNQEIIHGELDVKEETVDGDHRQLDEESFKLVIENSDTEVEGEAMGDSKLENGVSPASSNATIIMDSSSRCASPELASLPVDSKPAPTDTEESCADATNNVNLVPKECMDSTNIAAVSTNLAATVTSSDEIHKDDCTINLIPLDVSAATTDDNAISKSDGKDLSVLATGAISPESIENATNPLCDDIESVTSPKLVGEGFTDTPPGDAEEDTATNDAMTGSGRSSAALSDHSYVPKQCQDYKLSPVPSRIRLTGSSVWTPVTKSLSNMEESSTSSDAAITIVTNPFENCKQNLLSHISSVQDDIDIRLDFIEEQVAALEALDQASKTSHQDPLSDMPQVKKSLRTLLHDLAKVKRLAAFH